MECERVWHGFKISGSCYEYINVDIWNMTKCADIPDPINIPDQGTKKCSVLLLVLLEDQI